MQKVKIPYEKLIHSFEQFGVRSHTFVNAMARVASATLSVQRTLSLNDYYDALVRHQDAPEWL